MPKDLLFTPGTRQSWVKLAFWIFLILFAIRYIIEDAIPYFGLDEEVFGRFWGMKWPLVGHISGGLLALVLGPLQFWAGFRNRYLHVHRWMGRLYVAGIFVGSMSSITLALTTGMAIHWNWALSLIALAFAWISTTGMAFRFVLLKRINLHKEWMVRSYVVTFAFVLFRFLNSYPPIVENASFLERGATLIWVSWVIPLFVTEMVLQWNKKSSI
jgi:hypothetical protein